jgi:hypothetical protein
VFIQLTKCRACGLVQGPKNSVEKLAAAPGGLEPIPWRLLGPEIWQKYFSFWQKIFSHIGASGNLEMRDAGHHSLLPGS